MIVPAHWMPSNRALRECLELQADAPSRSMLARLFGVDPLRREARRSYSGALAEIALADSIAALGREWTVVHSVPLLDDVPEKHPAIDHLLIGPAGLFSITVHSHAGQDIWVGERTFLADDERLGHLAAAEEGASAVSRILAAALATTGTAIDVVAIPCIVVDSPATMQIRQRPGRIQVTTARNFSTWITALPRLNSPAVVDGLSAVALQSSTWPAHQVARGPVSEQGRAHRERDEFDRLRLHIASARFRRLLWTGLGVIASYSLALSSASALPLFGSALVL